MATREESLIAESMPVGISSIEQLPRIADPRGNLTFLEGSRHVPFQIKRIYYTYDVPGGEARGGHAHRECLTFIIAASGSFEVLLDDGHRRQRFFLNRSYHGILVPRMVWRELHNFSSGSVCLVLASEYFEEADYYRDYGQFLAAKRNDTTFEAMGMVTGADMDLDVDQSSWREEQYCWVKNRRSTSGA